MHCDWLCGALDRWGLLAAAAGALVAASSCFHLGEAMQGVDKWEGYKGADEVESNGRQEERLFLAAVGQRCRLG
jgi:hypothetical protein